MILQEKIDFLANFILSPKVKESWLRKYLKFYYWLQHCLLQAHRSFLLRKTLIERQAAAFLDAETSSVTKVGVGLILFSPLAKVLYKAFPEQGFGEYLINTSFLQIPNTLEQSLPPHFYTYYYWLWSMGEIWWCFWAFLGIYLLVDKPEAKTLIVFVLTYSLLHAINRMTSGDLIDFHAIANVVIYFPAAFIGVHLFTKVLVKALHEKNHGEEISNEKRIVGIVKLPGMTWEEKGKLLEQYELDK